MTESKTKATSFAVFAYVVILVMAGLTASASHALAGLAPAPINVRSSRAAAPATGMRAESLVYPPRDPAIIFDPDSQLCFLDLISDPNILSLMIVMKIPQIRIIES